MRWLKNCLLAFLHVPVGAEQALALFKMSSSSALPLGVKWENTAPARARRKQKRLRWLKNCLLAFLHLPVGAEQAITLFKMSSFIALPLGSNGKILRWLKNCLLAFPHLPVGTEQAIALFLL